MTSVPANVDAEMFVKADDDIGVSPDVPVESNEEPRAPQTTACRFNALSSVIARL